jgi:hypothetical protein
VLTPVDGRDLLVGLLGKGGLVRDQHLAGERTCFVLFLLIGLAAAVLGEQDVVERVLQEVMAEFMRQAVASSFLAVAGVLQNEPPAAHRPTRTGRGRASYGSWCWAISSQIR